jgi:hypothetical protein
MRLVPTADPPLAGAPAGERRRRWGWPLIAAAALLASVLVGAAVRSGLETAGDAARTSPSSAASANAAPAWLSELVTAVVGACGEDAAADASAQMEALPEADARELASRLVAGCDQAGNGGAADGGHQGDGNGGEGKGKGKGKGKGGD